MLELITEGEVKSVVTVETISPFLNPEIAASIPADYLSALVAGTWDWVKNYTNWPDTKEPTPGLLMVCADMVVFYGTTRSTYKEMKSEDMGLVFNTSLPNTITMRLTQYRRLRW